MHKWTIAIGSYPHTKALKDGAVTSSLLSLQFSEFRDIVESFDAMVEEQAFDVGELALGSFLQARAAGKPIVLLPAATTGGIHHQRLRYWPANGRLEPAHLRDKPLGVRAYSQTTGLWVRGILKEEYGIGYGDVKWLTTEGPHLKEYEEPSFVSRAPEGVSLTELLKSGDIVAFAGGDVEGTEPVIPNAAAAEKAWYERHQTMGIGHMISIRKQLVDEEPELVAELFRMMAESYRIGTPSAAFATTGLPSPIRIGFENVRAAVELAAEYATEQRLIPNVPDIDELFPSFLLGS